jgi:hypothetical protein
MGRVVRPGVVRVGDFPIVKVPCRTSLVRVGTRSRRPVEGASYESERSRGVPSAILALFRLQVVFYFFLIVDYGYP